MRTWSSGRWRLGAIVVSAALLSGCGGPEHRKQGHIRRGQEYFRAGNLDKARIEFLNAARLDPEDARLRERLGEVAESEGDLVEAFSYLSAALEREPTLSSARAGQARLMLLGNRTQAALESLELGLKTDPASAVLLAVRGSAKAQQGDLAGAQRDAETAFATDPANPITGTTLAAILRQQGRIDAAILVMREAVKRDGTNGELRAILADLLEASGQFPEAERELRQILSLRPAALRYRLRLARFYLLRGNDAQAESQYRQAIRDAPERLDVRMQLLAFIARTRGTEAAMSELRRMLDRESGNWQLRLAMGRNMAGEGLVDEARRLLLPISTQSSDSAAADMARVTLAELEERVGRSEAAMALLAPVLASSPQNSEALAVRGRILLAAGRPQEAIADLRVVLRGAPDAVPVLQAIAQAYLQVGAPELAEDSLRRAQEAAPRDPRVRVALARLLNRGDRYRESVEVLEAIAKELPLDGAVQETLIAAYAGGREWPAARQTAAALQVALPADPAGYRLGAAIEEVGGATNEALALYRRALSLSPADAPTLRAVSRLLLRVRRVEEAQQLIEAAMRHEPAAPLPYVLRGELRVASDQLVLAEQDFQEAERRDPSDPLVYRSLAITQLALRRTEAAYASLQRGIERSSSPQDIVTELAGILELQGRPEQAIEVYRWARQRFPDSAMIANNLAMLLVGERRSPAAIAEAEQLVQLLTDFDEPGFVDTRGWVKFRAGKLAEAETLLQQASDLARGAAEIRYHLALVQIARGRTDAARRNLEAALAGEPAFQGVEDARQALVRLQAAAALPRP